MARTALKNIDPTFNSCTTVTLYENAQDETLAPARLLIKSHGHWEEALRSSGATVEYSTTLESLREEIEVLRTQVSEVDVPPEPERVSSGLIKAFRARRSWKEGRNDKMRRPGKWVQNWLNTFSTFLTNYSGIVEVVKGADNQFGGIAYGTLSILLCIPVNKSIHESEIEDALEQFALSCPRLQTLQGTYPEKSQTLKSLIAKVFTDITLFARECVAYYQTSSIWRVTETMVHPPKSGIRAKVSTIRQTLLEIRLESEMLMHQRIAELQDNSEKLLSELRSLKSDLTSIEKDKDRLNLSILKSTLRLNDESPHLNIAAYKGQLDYAFSGIEMSEDADIMTFKGFISEPIVRDWAKCPESAMIVLAGENYESVNNATFSWISYGAIAAIEHFRNTAVVAHYFCQTTPVTTYPKRLSMQMIIASLWHQIACQAPSILRSCHEDIRRTVESADWHSDEEERVFKAAYQMFIQILSLLPKGSEVVVVLDRLDRCQTMLRPLMTWLVKLVRKADCVLKILVILQPQTSRGFLSAPQRSRLEDENIYFEKLDWDQDEGA